MNVQKTMNPFTFLGLGLVVLLSTIAAPTDVSVRRFTHPLQTGLRDRYVVMMRGRR